MRIITANVNGIRAAAKKGFFQWLAEQKADFICLQEIRADLSQLDDPIYFPTGYHCYYNPAKKKGYSGVALFTKYKPQLALTHILPTLSPLPLAYDTLESLSDEGRYIELQFEKLNIISLYLPSGTSGDHRQALKYQWMDVLYAHMQQFQKQAKPTIVCGDWNIAHKAIDLKNWKANQDHSGFLPEERAWMEKMLTKGGFIDAFRQVNQEAEQYTWWSNRGKAFANNVGWRIDYHITTAHLAGKVQQAEIYKQQRFSDHAPLIIDYQWDL